MRRFLCLGVLAVAPAAFAAEVQLYGKVYAEYARETAGVPALTTTTLADDQGTGRLGLRFSQSVAGGLLVFGQYEWVMTTDGGGNDFRTRDAFVGLRGGFGSLAFGRFNGAYKTHAGVDWDLFQFTSLTPVGQGGLSGGSFGNAGFVSRMVEYRTPRLGSPEGLHATGVVQWGGDDSPASPTARDSLLGGLSLGYQAWQVVLAASHDAAAGGRNLKLGVRHQGERLTLGLTHEDVDSGGYDPAGAGRFLLGHAEWRSGRWSWLAQAGRYAADHRDPLTGAADADARYRAAALRLHLAPEVWVHAGWRATASDLAGRDARALVLGLRFDFLRPL